MNHGPEPGERFRVEISSIQSHVAVDAVALRALAAHVLRCEGIDRAEVSVSLVDDAAIAPINRRYLDHEGPTDVITFPLSPPDSDELAGEIVISAETAAREAAARRLDPVDELRLYLVHGLLHLCGRDDRDANDRRRMHARQEELLVSFAGAVGASP
jgi:probable rRNA maturation factor